MIAKVCVIVIDQSLKVMDFDNLTAVFVILDKGVESFGFRTMLRQELLNVLVVKQILLCQS